MSFKQVNGYKSNSSGLTDDFVLSLVITYLCRESLETLQVITGAVTNPQLSRRLEAVKKLKLVLLEQPLPQVQQLRRIKDNLPDFVKDGVIAYQDVKLAINELNDHELVKRYYQTDRQVYQKLRNSVRSISNPKLAIQLSAVVARFQISCDSIKQSIEDSTRLH